MSWKCNCLSRISFSFDSNRIICGFGASVLDFSLGLHSPLSRLTEINGDRGPPSLWMAMGMWEARGLTDQLQLVSLPYEVMWPGGKTGNFVV